MCRPLSWTATFPGFLLLDMQVCSSGLGLMQNSAQSHAQQAGAFLCSAVSGCGIMHDRAQLHAQPAGAFLCSVVSGQSPRAVC